MTTAQKQSAINRINDRYNQIVKKFGADSYYAQNYHAKMRIIGGPDGFTASGRLKRGASVVASISEEALQAMEDQATAGQINKQIKANIAREEGTNVEDITPEDVQEYVDTETEARAGMEEIGADLSNALALYRARHNKQRGKLTYSEIKEAVKEWRINMSNSRKESQQGAYERHFGGRGADL